MDLATWWRDMRTRCAPMTVGEPIEYAELVDRIAAALAWIAPRDRFVFPELFEPYLEQLAATTWFGHRVAMDFMLYSPRSIAAGAEGDTPERHEDHDVARSAGLWIAIGAVLDKHEYFLCVDRTSAYCGYVVDAHDDHPYLNGTQYLSTIGTFEEWLVDVQEMRRGRLGYLFGLTGEERVLLDPLHDDPWALLVAARDLEYKLVPDSAWAHRKGEPERIHPVNRWPDVVLHSPLVSDDEGVPLVGFVPADALAALGAAKLADAPGGVLYVG